MILPKKCPKKTERRHDQLERGGTKSGTKKDRELFSVTVKWFWIFKGNASSNLQSLSWGKKKTVRGKKKFQIGVRKKKAKSEKIASTAAI